MATVEYLSSNAFQVVKVGCCLKGFKNFWEIAAEACLNQDFLPLFPIRRKKWARRGIKGRSVTPRIML